MSDSLWLELRWHSPPQVSVPSLWCFKSLSGKGRNKQGITTWNNSGPKVQECPLSPTHRPMVMMLAQSAHGWTHCEGLFWYQEHISLVPVHMGEELVNASLWQHPADSHIGDRNLTHSHSGHLRGFLKSLLEEAMIFSREGSGTWRYMEGGKENKTPHSESDGCVGGCHCSVSCNLASLLAAPQGTESLLSQGQLQQHAIPRKEMRLHSVHLDGIRSMPGEVF